MGRAEGIESQTVGIVDLVGIACFDIRVNTGNCFIECIVIDIGADVRHASRMHACIAAVVRHAVPIKPCGNLGCAHAFTTRKQQYLRRPIVIMAGNDDGQLRAKFIGKQADRKQAISQRLLHVVQHGGQLRNVDACQLTHVIRIQTRTRIGNSRVAIVEQCDAMRVVAQHVAFVIVWQYVHQILLPRFAR